MKEFAKTPCEQEEQKYKRQFIINGFRWDVSRDIVC